MNPAPAGSRRWRPSIRTYLVALVLAIGLAEGAGFLAERNRTLERSERGNSNLVRLHADAAAQRIDEAVQAARTGADSIAANEGLASLFLPGEPPPGCTLTFTGLGPFAEGRIDVVASDGEVRCSSDPLPEEPVHADAPWLERSLDEPVTEGPYVDPRSGGETLVVTAPTSEAGTVATFLELDGVAGFFDRSTPGSQPVRFELSPSGLSEAADDLIAADVTVGSTGWTLRAALERDAALANARSGNRQLLWSVLGSFAVAVAGTFMAHVGLARPIRRLRAEVRQGVDSDGGPRGRIGGPAEIEEIASDFEELRHEVRAELDRRTEAEIEAETSREHYRRLFASNPVPMWVHDIDDGSVLDVNDAALAQYGYTREEFLRLDLGRLWPEVDVDAAEAASRYDDPEGWTGIDTHQRSDGTAVLVEVTAYPLVFAGRGARFVMAEDRTAREQARTIMERAQRMESLGELAGGIAHDFNNVLAVMLSYAEFAEAELAVAAERAPDEWEQVRSDVEQIGVAGRRAAELTHQLLAFARGESAEAKVTDLNAVARDTEAMLRRTLGEHVDLELALEPDLWPIVANDGQLAQVIVNLAVNARDAMPDGGRLLVETANVDVALDELPRRPGLSAGPHVRLRVSDTGAGMDADTRDHAFEPLFTTKARGRGTGLGLATVYGIVTRSGGAIQLYSEPGLGTTVSILVPASDQPSRADEPDGGGAGIADASARILLVEDDEELRAVTERILLEAGHTVLVAAEGREALDLQSTATDPIDLVLTDVVMPEMSGPDLVTELVRRQPELRVLFMSGYAPPLLFADGRLPAGASLVDKPFSASALRRRVRLSLDSAPMEPADADGV